MSKRALLPMMTMATCAVALLEVEVFLIPVYDPAGEDEPEPNVS